MFPDNEPVLKNFGVRLRHIEPPESSVAPLSVHVDAEDPGGKALEARLASVYGSTGDMARDDGARTAQVAHL